MQTIAVGALVTAKTGRASWTALVAVAAFLPLGLLAPVGGALADRLDRRFWLAAGSTLQAALAGVLTALAATGHATPGVVTLLTFGNGCVAALTNPFQQAMIPDLVPREELLAAASLGSAQYNLGRVVGPALAGIVIAVSSYTWAFAINAVSFLAVVVALLFITLPAVGRDRQHAGIWRSIKAGARAARAEPACRAAILLIALAGLFVSPFIGLIPAKAKLLAHGAEGIPSATAALTTAQGVGAILGALTLVSLDLRLGRRRTVEVNLLGTCAALCLYAYAHSLTSAVLALGLVGWFYIGILSGLTTVVQLRAPAEFRGRILSLFFVALGVLYPVGILIHGALADRLSLERVTAGGAVGLAGLVLLIAALRPSILRALDFAITPTEIAGVTGTDDSDEPDAAEAAVRNAGTA